MAEQKSKNYTNNFSTVRFSIRHLRMGVTTRH